MWSASNDCRMLDGALTTCVCVSSSHWFRPTTARGTELSCVPYVRSAGFYCRHVKLSLRNIILHFRELHLLTGPDPSVRHRPSAPISGRFSLGTFVVQQSDHCNLGLLLLLYDVPCTTSV